MAILRTGDGDTAPVPEAMSDPLVSKRAAMNAIDCSWSGDDEPCPCCTRTRAAIDALPEIVPEAGMGTREEIATVVYGANGGADFRKSVHGRGFWLNIADAILARGIAGAEVDYEAAYARAERGVNMGIGMNYEDAHRSLVRETVDAALGRGRKA